MQNGLSLVLPRFLKLLPKGTIFRIAGIGCAGFALASVIRFAANCKMWQYPALCGSGWFGFWSEAQSFAYNIAAVSGLLVYFATIALKERNLKNVKKKGETWLQRGASHTLVQQLIWQERISAVFWVCLLPAFVGWFVFDTGTSLYLLFRF